MNNIQNKVLVTFASKYGATAEIAEKIADVLRQAELEADALPVDRVGDLAAYGAVILGSAVYMGAWRKEAATFLATHQDALAQRPVWLFSSGPTGQGDPVQLLNGWRFPETLKGIVERISPRDIAVFHGALDAQRLNLAEKLIIKGVKAPVGDYRSWEAIRAWAAGIAAALRG